MHKLGGGIKKAVDVIFAAVNLDKPTQKCIDVLLPSALVLFDPVDAFEPPQPEAGGFGPFDDVTEYWSQRRAP
jgi:hypothetical protein